MDLYTLQELATALKRSYSWVDKMVRADHIHHILMGGERMVNKEEYNRVLKEGVKKLPPKEMMTK